MNRSCSDTALVELLDKSVCTMLCSCENDATFNPFLLDNFHEQAAFVCLSEEHNFLVNTIHCDFFWRNVDFHCIVQERTSKVCN
jgi:hypothetical protein